MSSINIFTRVVSIGISFFMAICSVETISAEQFQSKVLREKSLTLARVGEINQAIKLWQQEALVYQAQKNVKKLILINLNISEAYIKLGDFDAAINQLNEILSLKNKDEVLNSIVLEKLGNSYDGKKQYFKAIKYYQTSLKLNQTLSCLNNLVKSWQNLIEKTQLDIDMAEQKARKNTQTVSWQNQKKYLDLMINYKAEALVEAQKAINLGEQENSLSTVYAFINWNNLSSSDLDDNQIIQARKILSLQAPSRQLIFVIINWSKIDRQNTVLWLQKAQKTAQYLKDSQALRYSNLELAYFYQKASNFEKALSYAQQTQLIAQKDFDHDTLYKAYWLAAKIYKRINQDQASLTAYSQAIASLDSINQEMSAKSFQKTTDFQLEIKPIYQEFIDLILEKKNITDKDIIKALSISDKLRLSELQNFFGDNCFELFENRVNQTISSKEATIYSIILQNKTYVILKLSNGSFYINKLNITQADLYQLAMEWQNNLINGYTWEFQKQGRKLYDLLIRPFDQQLIDSKINVLIFVHDGILRNLPMSALFDGQKYLAEKWASTTSLGFNFKPKTKASKLNEALIFGLSTNQLGWSSLSMVDNEVEAVFELLGGKTYLNRQFTTEKLTQELESNTSYSIVHLATHGYFSGNPYDSFFLTYDGRVNILQFGEMLKNSANIDLLVLSACETATGSDRSLLGLAGVAARNGVSSTLGSFWLVQDDRQNEIMNSFYYYWQIKKFNKAISLQKVQQDSIKKFSHPQKWAALNLIGDY